MEGGIQVHVDVTHLKYTCNIYIYIYYNFMLSQCGQGDLFQVPSMAMGGPFTPGLPSAPSAVLATPSAQEKRDHFQRRSQGDATVHYVDSMDPLPSPDGAGNGMQREGNGRPPTPPGLLTPQGSPSFLTDTFCEDGANKTAPQVLNNAAEEVHPPTHHTSPTEPAQQAPSHPCPAENEKRSIYEGGTYWQFLVILVILMKRSRAIVAILSSQRSSQG